MYKGDVKVITLLKLFVIIKHRKCVFLSLIDSGVFLQEQAVVRKRALETEYQQIREMLQRDEREAMNALDKDLESGTSKLNTLMKKFNQNVEKMSSTRAEINNLLDKSHSLDFLQVTTCETGIVGKSDIILKMGLSETCQKQIHQCEMDYKESRFVYCNVIAPFAVGFCGNALGGEL